VSGPPHKDRDRWLVVEGDDDKWVTIELLARHGSFWGNAQRDASADLPYVHVAGGISTLQDLVAVQAKGRHRLGVLLDADLAAGAAWSTLRRRLRGIADPPAWLPPMLAQLPEMLPREGLVVENDGRALGVWIMPDNGARGALEDFLVELVPPGDIHWQPARDAVSGAVGRSVDFAPQHRSKAEIHTWLAWQREPGVPFGRAVRSAYFLHDADGAARFVAWFRRVFPAAPPASA
jgi:hypothetical protein